MGDGFLTRWQGNPLNALLGAENGVNFLGSIFERDFCLSRGSTADRFAGLVTLADVDRIVTGTDLKDGDVVLANAGSGPSCMLVPFGFCTDFAPAVPNSACVHS